MNNMKKYVRSSILLLVLVASATVLSAQSKLHNLDIRVILSKNGDARITETRQMTIGNEGTECYIGFGNMSPSTVKDLTVSDETGRQYENIGQWNVKLDRSEKAGRCGIVEKDDGYELCWGLGDSGERTYVTSYTITSLVRGYPDADAIRHVFLDKTVNPKPDHAKVTIEAADASMSFAPGDCGVWGFRFKGDMRFERLFVEHDATRSQLLANGYGDVEKRIVSRKAQPQRRIARLAELTETVARQRGRRAT